MTSLATELSSPAQTQELESATAASPASPAPPAHISPTAPAITHHQAAGGSGGRGRILWKYAITILIIHALAACAVLPWLFSWTGLVLCIAGLYFYGTLGINLCYHRLLAHRSFSCPPWFEKALVINALCSLQDAPARWVAAHRIHHNHADHEPDPHSPLISFLWSHVGWMLVDKHGLHRINSYERWVRDMLRQRFYLELERRPWPFLIYLAHAALYFIVGYAIASLMGSGSPSSSPSMDLNASASHHPSHATLATSPLQFGLSLLVWGVFLRTVLVWHITWSVNSLTHMFGYRNYETDEESRNNWLVAILAVGEGWHNNHHADPASASNRRKWWEIDMVYGVICLLEMVGLAHDVVRPKHQRAALRSVASDG